MADFGLCRPGGRRSANRAVFAVLTPKMVPIFWASGAAR
jgi:hypothetical protein